MKAMRVFVTCAPNCAPVEWWMLAPFWGLAILAVAFLIHGAIRRKSPQQHPRRKET
jgi:hypothetical protein